MAKRSTSKPSKPDPVEPATSKPPAAKPKPLTVAEAGERLTKAQGAAVALRRRIEQDGDTTVAPADLRDADYEVEIAQGLLLHARKAEEEAAVKAKRDRYEKGAAEAKRVLPPKLAGIRKVRDELRTAALEALGRLDGAVGEFNELLKRARTELQDATDDDDVHALPDGVVRIKDTPPLRPLGATAELCGVLSELAAEAARRASASDSAAALVLGNAVRDLQAVATGNATKRAQQLFPGPAPDPQEAAADDLERQAQAEHATARAVRNARTSIGV